MVMAVGGRVIGMVSCQGRPAAQSRLFQGEAAVREHPDTPGAAMARTFFPEDQPLAEPHRLVPASSRAPASGGPRLAPSLRWPCRADPARLLQHRPRAARFGGSSTRHVVN